MARVVLRVMGAEGGSWTRTMNDGADAQMPRSPSPVRVRRVEPSAAVLAGISPGGSLTDATTGVCRSGPRGFVVTATYADALSRAEALKYPGPFAVVAVGAPILPPGPIHYEPRPCERIFRWAPFQTHCAAQETSSGSGAAFRRAGCDTARQFARVARHIRYAAQFPRVHPTADLIEAFPRGVLSVMLPEGAFAELPSAGGRINALHASWLRTGASERLQAILPWPDAALWRALSSRDLASEEIAAVACAVTAVGAWLGRYVAAGEPEGGYVFLPPWELWEGWARRGLDENRRSRRLSRPVEVWIDGKRFRPGDALPT